MNTILAGLHTPSSPARVTERSSPPRPGAAHDAELVQRFNTGDEGAFLEIMRRYQAKIFTVTQGLLHNQADAEEIAQDTFIRAHRGLARFRGDSSLATWLHRIAVNLARNRYWYFFRRRRHATVSLDCPIGEDGDATFSDLIATDAPDPARLSTREEFSSLVSECMGKPGAAPPRDPRPAQRAQSLLRRNRHPPRHQCRHGEEPDRPGPGKPPRPPGRDLPGIRPGRRSLRLVRAEPQSQPPRPRLGLIL